MARQNKARYRFADGSGSNENRLTVNQMRYFNPYYKHVPHSVQCRNCGSDYMCAALNNVCQRCLQRAEFEIRERGSIAERIRKGGRS